MAWIALVGPEVEENLGMRYVAAALGDAGYDVALVPFDRQQDFNRVRTALLQQPEPPMLVGVSLAFQWRAMDVLALVIALRMDGFAGHLTGGGHFGAFAAGELLRDFPELDSLCLHEAETTAVELARAVESGGSLGGIAGLAWRDDAGTVHHNAVQPPPALEGLPWPDRRGNPTSCLGHGMAPLVASRGCYARCSFCCIAAWHAQATAGPRFRLRPMEDVAAEMAWLHHQRGVEIFVFHDDDFFVPGPGRALQRIDALADHLQRLEVGRIATVVKARPTDVAADVFERMQRRLGCVRVFLGIETVTEQGLRTLRRGVQRDQHRDALAILDALGLYVCFNLLVFDPDTTLDDLRANLDFLESSGHCAANFGRVELYAGTPLLARMQREGRHRGDYLWGDYPLATAEVQRVYELFQRCFHPRNFAGEALANRLMGTRFDVEVCRHFHPDRFEPRWLEQARALTTALASGSVAGMRELIGFVERHGAEADAGPLVEDLGSRLRGEEQRLASAAADLEQRVQQAVGARCRHALDHAGPILRSAHGMEG